MVNNNTLSLSLCLSSGFTHTDLQTMKVLEAKHEALDTARTSVSTVCFLSGIYAALSEQRGGDAVWILSRIYSSSPGERVVRSARSPRSAAPHRIIRTAVT